MQTGFWKKVENRVWAGNLADHYATAMLRLLPRYLQSVSPSAPAETVALAFTTGLIRSFVRDEEDPVPTCAPQTLRMLVDATDSLPLWVRHDPTFLREQETFVTELPIDAIPTKGLYRFVNTYARFPQTLLECETLRPMSIACPRLGITLHNRVRVNLPESPACTSIAVHPTLQTLMFFDTSGAVSRFIGHVPWHRLDYQLGESRTRSVNPEPLIGSAFEPWFRLAKNLSHDSPVCTNLTFRCVVEMRIPPTEPLVGSIHEFFRVFCQTIRLDLSSIGRGSPTLQQKTVGGQTSLVLTHNDRESFYLPGHLRQAAAFMFAHGRFMDSDEWQRFVVKKDNASARVR